MVGDQACKAIGLRVKWLTKVQGAETSVSSQGLVVGDLACKPTSEVVSFNKLQEQREGHTIAATVERPRVVWRAAHTRLSSRVRKLRLNFSAKKRSAASLCVEGGQHKHKCAHNQGKELT